MINLQEKLGHFLSLFIVMFNVYSLGSVNALMYMLCLWSNNADSVPLRHSEMWKYTGAHVYVSYHSECLGLVDCRQPGADYVDSASWTALWEQRILGQQVKGGMTREHLQKSEYTMWISLYQDKKSQCRYSESVEQWQHVLNWPH